MKTSLLLITVAGLSVLSACAEMPGDPNQAPPGLNDAPAIDAPDPIGKKDDLRVGAAPIASPYEIEIEIFNPDEAEVEITEIRRDALREAAQGYGSQMGYARRGWEIEKLLEKRSSELSQVYDFNRVVGTAPAKVGYVIPPIVSRSFDAFTTQDDGKEASVADEYLTIIRPGKLTPVVPTWRDYLLFTGVTPEELAKSLAPRNEEEKKLFDAWLREGWTAGADLADAELSSRLDRLNRDYQGMLQYRRLVSIGMMDRIVLQDGDFGVTGGGDEMRIGSRTVKVISDAEFETDPTQWSIKAVTELDSMIVDQGTLSPDITMKKKP